MYLLGLYILHLRKEFHSYISKDFKLTKQWQPLLTSGSTGSGHLATRAIYYVCCVNLYSNAKQHLKMPSVLYHIFLTELYCMHKCLQQLALPFLEQSWTRQTFRRTFYQWPDLASLETIIQERQELMQKEWHISWKASAFCYGLFHSDLPQSQLSKTVGFFLFLI